MSNAVVFAIAFYALSIAIITAALGVVVLRNIVHAALALIATLFLVAWLYLMLNADLLWVAQLLIYAGAVPVLIVFAIVFTRRSMSDTSSGDTSNRIWGALVGAGIFALLLAVLLPAHWFTAPWPGLVGTTAVLGHELVVTYGIPFEVVSVLLLAGLIGAVVLAKREGDGGR